jgi:hypothetical protein
VHISYINYYFVSILEGQVHFADGKTHSNFRSFLDILKDNDCTHRPHLCIIQDPASPPMALARRQLSQAFCNSVQCSSVFPDTRAKHLALGTCLPPLLSSPLLHLYYASIHFLTIPSDLPTMHKQSVLKLSSSSVFFFFFWCHDC